MPETVPVQDGRLLVVQAANSGNIALLEKAIKAGIALDAISDDGSSALHCAARTGQVAIVQYLFQSDANITIMNKAGRTPFQEAILGGDVATIKYMLENRMSAMETKDRLLSTFEILLRNKSAEVAKTIAAHLESEIGWEEHGLSMLRQAIKYKHVDYVRWLSSSGRVDINKHYETTNVPIRHAAKVGHPGVFEALLMSENLNPNVTAGWNKSAPFHIAVKMSNLELVQLLLQDNRVDVNVKTGYGQSPLHKAVSQGEIEIAKLILANPKVDVNTVTKNDRDTPLHCAVEKSRLVPPNTLLNNSAAAFGSASIVERSIPEPLFICSRSQMVQILCQAPGIRLNLKNRDGKTPLQLAVSKRCWPIAQCLLGYARAKRHLGSSAEICLPPLRSSDLPGLLQELTWHEDFQSTQGLKDLLFGAARDRVPEGLSLLSQTHIFDSIITGSDTAAALLCAVCTATYSTEALQYVLQQPNTNVNQWLHDELSALQLAVLLNSTEAVRLLLEHRQIDVNRYSGWSSWLMEIGVLSILSCCFFTARDIVKKKYGPQSSFEDLFAAHELRKSLHFDASSASDISDVPPETLFDTSPTAPPSPLPYPSQALLHPTPSPSTPPSSSPTPSPTSSSPGSSS